MAELTKCPFCAQRDLVSRLTPSPVSSSTLMATSPGYYDEAGTWIPPHDPNWHTRSYSCSGGHQFTRTTRQGEADKIMLTATLTVTPNDGGFTIQGNDGSGARPPERDP